MDNPFRVVNAGTHSNTFGVTTQLAGGTGAARLQLDSTRFGLIYANPDSGGALPVGARMVATGHALLDAGGGVLDSTVLTIATITKAGTGQYDATVAFPHVSTSDLRIVVYRIGGIVETVVAGNAHPIHLTDWPSTAHFSLGAELVLPDTSTIRIDGVAGSVVGDRIRVMKLSLPSFRRLVRADLEARNMASFVVVGAVTEGPVVPAADRSRLLWLSSLLVILGLAWVPMRATLKRQAIVTAPIAAAYSDNVGHCWEVAMRGAMLAWAGSLEIA